MQEDEEQGRQTWRGCPVEASFFGDERKTAKKERKEARQRDRSQYKKTDQNKNKTIPGKSPTDQDLPCGRVLAITSQGITVDSQGTIFTCSMRGALKQSKILTKNLAAVGDLVRFIPTKEQEGTIYAVMPRYSLLSRADNLLQRRQQIIAANIDLVLVTLSVGSPPLKPNLIDRYLIAADKGGMQAVLVVNKIDRLDELEEEQKALFKTVCDIYTSLGFTVLPVSAYSGEGIEALSQLLKDKASAFAGQSGVGKSSLINALTGLSLRTGDVVRKTHKGAHTTTSAQLIPLLAGGFCIDTPGIKSFGLWNIGSNEVEAYFPEIFACRALCRFPNCRHIEEEHCGVKRALEEGAISPLRYISYCSLLLGVDQPHMTR